MPRDAPIVLPHPIAGVIRTALAQVLAETNDTAIALITAAREVRRATPGLGFYESFVLVDRLWVR